ncbi:hypothetical protein CWO90_13835 [Bradyrhizobium sp. Leo121]|nr:hypothetical protein CWO90_13835 [Bradyrhizobium sp. Leo121]
MGGVNRTGIPLDSTEIGNLGVSSAAPVPTPGVSLLPGVVGPVAALPTVPTVLTPAPTASTSTMAGSACSILTAGSVTSSAAIPGC